MSSLEYWLDSIVSPHFPALTTDAKAMSSTAVSSVQTELSSVPVFLIRGACLTDSLEASLKCPPLGLMVSTPAPLFTQKRSSPQGAAHPIFRCRQRFVPKHFFPMNSAVSPVSILVAPTHFQSTPLILSPFPADFIGRPAIENAFSVRTKYTLPPQCLSEPWPWPRSL